MEQITTTIRHKLFEPKLKKITFKSMLQANLIAGISAAADQKIFSKILFTQSECLSVKL